MTTYGFLSGALTSGFLVCSLLFARSWRRTSDGLFLAFALAFGLLAVGQIVAVFGQVPTEYRSTVYLIRLAAFALILAAIWRKNRS